MDNASNNDTCMETLERELKRRQISFDRLQRRIRYADALLDQTPMLTKLLDAFHIS